MQMTLLCCENKESIIKVFHTTKRFSTINGSLENWGKCPGFWHGEWHSAPYTFANVSWVTAPVMYLEAPLQFYKDSEPYWHVTNKHRRLEQRQTSGRGGICLPLLRQQPAIRFSFVYVMQVLHCSRTNIQKLHQVFAAFVWASTWERCSHTNLFRRVKDEGLGLTHLLMRQLVNRFLF